MTASRVAARHHFLVPAPVARVFALFDPIAEKDWVDGWDPLPVHPQELSLEAGSVFFLDRDGRREVWTVLRHDPVAYVAEYLATTPDYQQRWITVRCTTEADGTRVDVEYRITGLSTEGRREMESFDASHIRHWEAPVAKALGLGVAGHA